MSKRFRLLGPPALSEEYALVGAFGVKLQMTFETARAGKGASFAFGMRAGGRVLRLGMLPQRGPVGELAGSERQMKTVRVTAEVSRGCGQRQSQQLCMTLRYNLLTIVYLHVAFQMDILLEGLVAARVLAAERVGTGRRVRFSDVRTQQVVLLERLSTFRALRRDTGSA